MEAGPRDSFPAFLRKKWLVLVLLLLFGVYATFFAGWNSLSTPQRTLLFLVNGVGTTSIVAYLWYRLGRIAWPVVISWYLVGVISGAVMKM